MALLAVNDVPVSSGSIAVPLEGRWVADLHLAALPDGSLERDTLANLEWSDGTTANGRVIRVGLGRGHTRCLIVGGRALRPQALRARYFERIPLETAIRDAIREAGETPGEIHAPGTLERWARRADAFEATLKRLCAQAPGLKWRTRLDGVIDVQAPSWATTALQVTALEVNPATTRVTTAHTPALEPGVTATIERPGDPITARVLRVNHIIGSKPRTVITLENHQLLEALRRLVEDPTAPYRVRYPCAILKDHGDMHLDVQPTDPSLPPLTRVPLRLGLPGAKVTVQPNGEALLGFLEGDPERPFLELPLTALKTLEITGADEIRLVSQSVKLGSGALLDNARTTDAVQVTIFVAPSLLGKISAVPAVEPQPVGPALPFVPVTVDGQITGGSSQVKSG